MELGGVEGRQRLLCAALSFLWRSFSSSTYLTKGIRAALQPLRPRTARGPLHHPSTGLWFMPKAVFLLQCYENFVAEVDDTTYFLFRYKQEDKLPTHHWVHIRSNLLVSD